ncbi:cytochrome c oxidase subunit 3 [Occallatibacter riparius]|uniref:Cytochrome c oxidase subunit 3 n=1 Tax=Occallatibacter riparius TaxID=1002689 RepID=A0A9J7BQX0_9BACT|nr:cytochrome c oxidase subunit 3 [Occallatibacter riparius]UWZ84138.1 cytochrome c oxidase subunit 3 [Occallatibacter riparius]
MAERVERPVLDVSSLPTVHFGSHSLTWWGIMGMMAIEGTVFLLMIASYFYLHSRTVEWPPHRNPPDLLWGTVNLALFLISALPNEWYRRRARKGDLRAVQIGLVVLSLFGVAIVGVRYLELLHLNTDWSVDAYGSAVWTLMGLHVLHLLTDLVDTIVLTVLFFTSLVEGKRFMDAEENAAYWYFVVAFWIPIYLVIYWAPRWLHA